VISFRLGRNRILDTALASVYYLYRSGRLAMPNPDDFKILNISSTVTITSPESPDYPTFEQHCGT
jgi:hypothetical protein